MVFNKLKSTAKERGFTIVELLIVIVVIAILAAITIVAYNGVQQKAKTTQAQTNAVQAQKVAEAFNADNSKYPAVTGDFRIGTTAKLPTSIILSVGPAGTPTAGTPPLFASGLTTSMGTTLSANPQTTIAFSITGTAATPTGGVLMYWDSSTSAISTNYIYYGAATATSAFLTPAS